MISFGALGQTIVPVIHGRPQINTIYIFCDNKTRHEKWTKEWLKVKGVYTDTVPICEVLKQTTQDCDHNLVSISFDMLDSSFMYTQILKKILITIDFEQIHFNE
jgi:hypothetical protein